MFDSMKFIFTIITVLILTACSDQSNPPIKNQDQGDTLQNKPNNVYKPGFGEFMSSIQVHHNKLWFAGENNNWKLANFEIQEIDEAIENIKKFEVEREESQKIDMIRPALDSVNTAIEQKNKILFKSSFVLLTNTCNNCHRATNFEFNEIKIPDSPPFSNQVFKLPDEK